MVAHPPPLYICNLFYSKDLCNSTLWKWNCHSCDHDYESPNQSSRDERSVSHGNVLDSRRSGFAPNFPYARERRCWRLEARPTIEAKPSEARPRRDYESAHVSATLAHIWRGLRVSLFPSHARNAQDVTDGAHPRIEKNPPIS